MKIAKTRLPIWLNVQEAHKVASYRVQVGDGHGAEADRGGVLQLEPKGHRDE